MDQCAGKISGPCNYTAPSNYETAYDVTCIHRPRSGVAAIVDSFMVLANSCDAARVKAGVLLAKAGVSDEILDEVEVLVRPF